MGQGLGLGAVRANPKGGRLYPVGPWSSAFRKANLAPSVDPGLVLREPTPKRPFGSLDPVLRRMGPKAFCVVRSESRTDPLETPVSLDFRAAVSLGPLTFRRNPL